MSCVSRGLELRDLVAGHRLHLLVRLRVAHVAGAGQLLADVAQLPVRGDDRLQARQLPAQPAQLVGIGEDLGRAELAADLVVLAGEAGELGVEAGVAPWCVVRARRAAGRAAGRMAGRGAGGLAPVGRASRTSDPGAGRLGLLRRHRGRPAAVSPGFGIGSRARSRPPSGMASPSALIASSSDTIATSIMSSVGCLVVIFWTRIPGHMITLTTGFERWRAPRRRSS